MNKLITFVFLFFSTFLFAQIPAGYKPVKDTLAFKQKMEAQSKLVNTIESDFTQEKYLSVMSESFPFILAIALVSDDDLIKPS